MKIGVSLNSLPIDPKRELGKKDDGKVGAKDASKSSGVKASGAMSTQVEVELDPQRLQKFIDTLKNMDPSDLHRVEELRQQIDDGSYQANAGDMVDSLLSFLDDGRLET